MSQTISVLYNKPFSSKYNFGDVKYVAASGSYTGVTSCNKVRQYFTPKIYQSNGNSIQIIRFGCSFLDTLPHQVYCYLYKYNSGNMILVSEYLCQFYSESGGATDFINYNAQLISNSDVDETYVFEAGLLDQTVNKDIRICPWNYSEYNVGTYFGYAQYYNTAVGTWQTVNANGLPSSAAAAVSARQLV